jgi:hypothetical protein
MARVMEFASQSDVGAISPRSEVCLLEADPTLTFPIGLFVTHYGSRAAPIVVMHKRFLLGKAKRVGIFENYAQEESRRAIKSARRGVT